jgi:hypothetical protein
MDPLPVHDDRPSLRDVAERIRKGLDGWDMEADPELAEFLTDRILPAIDELEDNRQLIERARTALDYLSGLTRVGVAQGVSAILNRGGLETAVDLLEGDDPISASDAREAYLATITEPDRLLTMALRLEAHNGGHATIGVFVGRTRGARGKAGQITLREDEWAELRDRLAAERDVGTEVLPPLLQDRTRPLDTRDNTG